MPGLTPDSAGVFSGQRALHDVAALKPVPHQAEHVRIGQVGDGRVGDGGAGRLEIADARRLERVARRSRAEPGARPGRAARCRALPGAGRRRHAARSGEACRRGTAMSRDGETGSSTSDGLRSWIPPIPSTRRETFPRLMTATCETWIPRRARRTWISSGMDCRLTRTPSRIVLGGTERNAAVPSSGTVRNRTRPPDARSPDPCTSVTCGGRGCPSTAGATRGWSPAGAPPTA